MQFQADGPGSWGGLPSEYWTSVDDPDEADTALRAIADCKHQPHGSSESKPITGVMVLIEDKAQTMQQVSK